VKPSNNMLCAEGSSKSSVATDAPHIIMVVRAVAYEHNELHPPAEPAGVEIPWSRCLAIKLIHPPASRTGVFIKLPSMCHLISTGQN
jgi:hypothetical protein